MSKKYININTILIDSCELVVNMEHAVRLNYFLVYVTLTSLRQSDT